MWTTHFRLSSHHVLKEDILEILEEEKVHNNITTGYIVMCWVYLEFSTSWF